MHAWGGASNPLCLRCLAWSLAPVTPCLEQRLLMHMTCDMHWVYAWVFTCYVVLTPVCVSAEPQIVVLPILCCVVEFSRPTGGCSASVCLSGAYVRVINRLDLPTTRRLGAALPAIRVCPPDATWWCAPNSQRCALVRQCLHACLTCRHATAAQQRQRLSGCKRCQQQVACMACLRVRGVM
jgi:hypothetical protein